MVEINEAERKKEKKGLQEVRTTSETSGTMLNVPTFKSQKSQRIRRQKERP